MNHFLERRQRLSHLSGVKTGKKRKNITGQVGTGSSGTVSSTRNGVKSSDDEIKAKIPKMVTFTENATYNEANGLNPPVEKMTRSQEATSANLEARTDPAKNTKIPDVSSAKKVKFWDDIILGFVYGFTPKQIEDLLNNPSRYFRPQYVIPSSPEKQ